MALDYATIASAVAPTGMVARGGFEPTPDDAVPSMADGRAVATVVVIGNIGGAMWPRFRSDAPAGPEPLDGWTRAVLVPIAEGLGADFVHPSDEPFRPFQRWARRADDVWASPIGLLVHAEYGLWHAYRGAFLLAEPVADLPATGSAVSPCVTCRDQPCLTTCPVEAFAPDAYDVAACAGHVRSGDEPRCLQLGCAARLACPVGTEHRYGPDQMAFHMRAFVGGRV